MKSLRRNPLFTNHSWPIHHNPWKMICLQRRCSLKNQAKRVSLHCEQFLPETNSSTLKNRPSAPKGNFIFQPSILQGDIVGFREGFLRNRSFYLLAKILCKWTFYRRNPLERFEAGGLTFSFRLSFLVNFTTHFCFLGMCGKNTHLSAGNFKYLLFSPQNLGEMIQPPANGWLNHRPTCAIQQRSGISSPGMMCPVTICTSQLMIVNGLLHLRWWATVPRQRFFRGERSCRSKKKPGFPKRTPEDSVVLRG